MKKIDVPFVIGDTVWAIEQNPHRTCIACSGKGRLTGPGFYDHHDRCPACSGSGFVWGGKPLVRQAKVSDIHIGESNGIEYSAKWTKKRKVGAEFRDGDTWGESSLRVGFNVFATQPEARAELKRRAK